MSSEQHVNETLNSDAHGSKPDASDHDHNNQLAADAAGTDASAPVEAAPAASSDAVATLSLIQI